MPVPEGIISTSTGPVDPNAPVEAVVKPTKKKAKPVEEAPIDAEEAEDIAAFDAAIAAVEEELPEAEADDL
jgi:hypothetical protein